MAKMGKVALKKALTKASIPFTTEMDTEELQALYDAALADGVITAEPKEAADATKKVAPAAPAVEKTPEEVQPEAEPGVYVALETISHNGTMYEPGQEIDLDGVSAFQLIESGSVKTK